MSRRWSKREEEGKKGRHRYRKHDRLIEFVKTPSLKEPKKEKEVAVMGQLGPKRFS